MKKLLLLSFCLAFFLSCKDNKISENEADVAETGMEQVPDMHTSEISLDWPGTYTGIVPCADCEGIKTEVVLKDDNTFEINRVYLGKDDTIFQETGRFQWTQDGSTVVLTQRNNETSKLYKVGENHLKQLDLEGNVIKGELAEMYILKKIK